MATVEANILIIDDDIDVLETAKMFLKQQFSSITIEKDPRNLPELLAEFSFDLILLDMNFRKGVNDGEEGFYWLELIKKINPDIIVVLITAYGEIDLAVRAIKKGASDFVLKPWKNQKLLGTILSAIELGKSKREIKSLKETQKKLVENITQPESDFIGESREMQAVFKLIDKVADTDANVLLLGENGTGKELAARALHSKSSRSDSPFIAVDMGAIAENLFESELFGHIKGSFTDAHTDKKGSFELAADGTIFLDEIGNIPVNLQAKLLTVLQSRLVRPVGSNSNVKINARLVCATNMSLTEMVAGKSFRQDLLYRINTVELTLPSLRDRRDDIERLVQYFSSYYAKKYHKPLMNIDKRGLEQLENYDWPGNVRELQHSVERAVILSDGGKLLNPDLMISVGNSERIGDEPETLAEMEKEFILKKLAAEGGNVTKTAVALGLTRTALYRRMNKHNLL